MPRPRSASSRVRGFGVDQHQLSRDVLKSFEISRRVWADEKFVHRGPPPPKYWTFIMMRAPVASPGAASPHPLPFSAQAKNRAWAAQHDIPFVADRLEDRAAKRDQALYRRSSTAYGPNAPLAAAFLIANIYLADSSAQRPRQASLPAAILGCEQLHAVYPRGRLPDTTILAPAGSDAAAMSFDRSSP